MDATRRGDRTAFGRLVGRHRAWVTAVLGGIVEDPDAAQDLAQEVFCRLFANPDAYEARDGRFVPWLKTVAVNAGRNFLRGRRRRRAVPLPDAWEEGEAGEEQRRLDPQTVVASRLLADGVRDALGALSEEQRQAVTLHYFAGRSVEEIAAALGCAPGTVKSRLFYARKRLRETLGGDADSH